MNNLTTCRFCRKQQIGTYGFVKYGVRHYAHHGCFLKNKGADGLKALPAWKIGQFPYYALKQYGLMDLAYELAPKRNQ